MTAGADPTTTIYVAGLLEKVTRSSGTEFRHQIHGPTGPIAIYTRRSSGTADTYYLHRDHLGSPELVTNATGAQVVKLSFGAFGERRGATWTGTPSSGDWTAIGNTTRDGFTDHEHLDAVGLVHMHGRVYDPRIGRFLSPDPFIDWGLGTQGVNRYGYVGNNPLNRIDPSGFTACDPFGHGPIRVDGNDMPRFAEIVVRGAQFPPPPPGAFITFEPMPGNGGRVFEMGTPGGDDYEKQEVSALGEVEVTATRTAERRKRPPPGVVFGGGPGGVVAAGASDAGGPDPMKNTADHDTCVDDCRTRLEPAVQGAAGAAGAGTAAFALTLNPGAAGTASVVGGVVGVLSGAGAPGAVAVPYAGAAGATADMIVGGGGGMSNPFSRGGWIASLIGSAASRTPADARTQVTLGASAAAYVDGLAAARAAGFSYTGSNLGGRTALAIALAGGAAWLTYTGADLAATAACEGICGR